MPEAGQYVSWRTFAWTLTLLSGVYVLVLTAYVMPNIERQKERQAEDYTQRLLLKQATESEMTYLKSALARVEALAIAANEKLAALKATP